VLEPIASQLIEEAGVRGFLVLDQCTRSWKHMQSFDNVVDNYPRCDDTRDLLSEKVDPEDNATIIFTSGKYSRSYPLLSCS
jgi:hypothetical protein